LILLVIFVILCGVDFGGGHFYIGL